MTEVTEEDFKELQKWGKRADTFTMARLDNLISEYRRLKEVEDRCKKAGLLQ